MRPWIMLAVVMLAGCAESAPPMTDEPPQDAPIHEGTDETPATPTAPLEQEHLNVSLDLTLNQYLGATINSSNCAGFDIDRIISGKATATWTPNLDPFPEIELGIRGENARQAVVGPSPLTLEFTEDVRHGFFDKIILFTEAPTIQHGLKIHVTLDVTYEGGSGTHSGSSCSM